MDMSTAISSEGRREQTCSDSERKPLFRVIILLLIVLLAAFLRLVKPGQSPPGLNQDEAANAWSAYCLLKTGKDQVGVSWPIFYTRALGGNNSTLFIYLLLPFQLIGGMSIFTTRLLPIVSGVLTVPLIYFVGKRLFDGKTGLLAALLLALNPWHLHLSRWAIEAAICPLLGLVPLAMLLWSDILTTKENSCSPRLFLAAIGGAATGICCYGYHSMRLFVPIFLLFLVLLTLPQWRRSIKSSKGILAVCAFVITLVLVFGPMVWLHIFQPEGIGRHGADKYWLGSHPLPVAIKNVFIRYVQHFGPVFLFMRPEINPIQFPPNLFHWYMLPIMLFGLIVLAKNFRTSSSIRVLLAFILVYPTGDLMAWPTMHPLRCSPGLCSMILLAAVGAARAGEFLWQKNRKTALSVFLVFAAVVAALNARYLHYFYGEYNREPGIYHLYHTDLVEACQWLKPWLNDFDAVFFTTTDLNMPYIITLVVMGYEPREWFGKQRAWFTEGEFDYYTNYGKMHFIYGQPIIPILNQLPPDARILVIVRPGELDLKNPIHQIYRPYDGEPALWMCQP